MRYGEGAYRKVSLFQEGAAISFQPYSAGKLVHSRYQLIAFDLKQLSSEAVGPGSLVVFKSLYRNSDLVMAVRRYLHPVFVDCCRFAVFSYDKQL